MKKLLKIIYYKILSLRNSKFFYKEHKLSFSFGWLFFANIFYSGRTIQRLKNNKSKRFKLFQINRLKNKTSIDINIKMDRENPKETIRLAEAALRTHGAVVIENYFSESDIIAFEKYYSNEIIETKAGESRFDVYPTLSKELLNFWLNPLLIDLYTSYFGQVPLARSYPSFQYVDKNTQLEDISSMNETIAFDWHIDHCSILTQMVYLSQVFQSGTCMEIVSGSHKYPNVAVGLYSPEYINSGNFEIKQLCGPRGSVQIHDPNVVHRARPILGSERVWFYSDFCWGENILFNYRNVVKMLSKSNLNIEEFDSIRRKVLSGIFPLIPDKGFELNKGFLTPNKYQGI